MLEVDREAGAAPRAARGQFPGAGRSFPTRAHTFNVGYFDFPVIDNTRLANGLRCAVTLTNSSPDAAPI